MSTKINIQTCYRIILEALAAGVGIQSMTDAVFSYTKMPIHAVDISYKVIAASYESSTGSKHIDEMIGLKAVPSEVVLFDYDRLGYLDSVKKLKKSMVVDWGVVEIPQASGAIWVNGIMEGICATTFFDPSMKDDALEINDMLCKAIAIEMERKRLTSEQDVETVHHLRNRLIFKDFFDATTVDDEESLLELGSLKPQYQFIAINSDMNAQARFSQVKKEILSRHPNLYHLIFGECLYLMIDHLEENDTTTLIEVGDVVKKYGCWCGISSPFSDISQRKKFRQSAQRTLEFGRRIHPKRRIYDFRDYFLELNAYHAMTDSDLFEAAYHLPELERLRAVDEEKGTDYYYTLKTYLVLNAAVTLTAKQLHIHRNTLIYRIGKINEIMGVDINDRILSRKLLTGINMRYIDQIMNGKFDPLLPKEDDFWLRDLT